MSPVQSTQPYSATQNACKLCTPLGAALVFKGIQGAVPLLHGSQGCSTYIRRYLISHFKEPIDIACSNFAEETAIFGGGANLKRALENIRLQYAPELVGIATTCLSETIGDDVPMFIRDYQAMGADQKQLPMVHVSTPSYQGTHMQGFHAAVRSCIRDLAVLKRRTGDGPSHWVNVFPGMLSPADLRYMKEILDSFGLSYMMLPDYSATLDGPLWTQYHRIPPGGTRVDDIRAAGSAVASLEFGSLPAADPESAGKLLESRFQVPCHQQGLPVGLQETDRLFSLLSQLSGGPIPETFREERGRLVDAIVDGHKYVNGVRAAVYGEEDLVIGLVSFLSEIGVQPVLCATGDRTGHFRKQLSGLLSDELKVQVMDDADFVDMETALTDLKPDLIIGHSKGYSMARRLNIPLIRVGFPIHDRIGGPRLLHIGYRGAQQLFDRIANTIIEHRQDSSPVGYTYM